MIPLITLSHGSRRAGSRTGISQLTEAAGELAGVPSVDAHLEFTEPGLDEVVEKLSEQGITRAAVVPLLFTNAYHARVDVPSALADAQSAHGVELLLGPSLGTGSDVAEALTEALLRDAEPGAHVILYSVGSSHISANEAVVDLGDTVAQMSGHSVEVVPATGGAGSGGAGVIEVASAHRGQAVHLLPLFVTEGLLLDRIVDKLDRVAAATGTRFTTSPPLTTALAPLVAARYHAAKSALLAHI